MFRHQTYLEHGRVRIWTTKYIICFCNLYLFFLHVFFQHNVAQLIYDKRLTEKRVSWFSVSQGMDTNTFWSLSWHKSKGLLLISPLSDSIVLRLAMDQLNPQPERSVSSFLQTSSSNANHSLVVTQGNIIFDFSKNSGIRKSLKPRAADRGRQPPRITKCFRPPPLSGDSQRLL